MPTETFYNLPEEKRGRLVKAIYLELARVPFSEMSINRIIKEAQISRGSYYQYFRDRDDLYQFILEKTQVLGKQLVDEQLAACGGDLFSALPEILSRAAAYVTSPQGNGMARHLAEEVQLRELRSPPLEYRCCAGGILEDMWDALDRSTLRAESREEFFEMLPIFVGVFARHLMEILAGADPEDTKERFARAMDWLRYGMGEKA